jgi:hypothetical protein
LGFCLSKHEMFLYAIDLCGVISYSVVKITKKTKLDNLKMFLMTVFHSTNAFLDIIHRPVF